MPHYQSGNIRLFYEERGSGMPLVFLHGFTLDHRMWKGQLDFFSRLYRVIAPDSRGHGQSDAPPTGYSRDHRAEDLKNLLDELDIDKAHIVGLSMGGTTAIGLALKYPRRLQSLTLVSTGAAGYKASKKIAHLDELARNNGIEAARNKWMEWALAWYKKRHHDVGEKLKEMMDEHTGAVWADPMRGKYPRTRDLHSVHRIKIPTLIMAGAYDKVFLPLAEELNKEILNSRLVVFEENGHMLNMEAPALFNSELKGFLETAG